MYTNRAVNWDLLLFMQFHVTINCYLHAYLYRYKHSLILHVSHVTYTLLTHCFYIHGYDIIKFTVLVSLTNSNIYYISMVRICCVICLTDKNVTRLTKRFLKIRTTFIEQRSLHENYSSECIIYHSSFCKLLDTYIPPF